ncbi:cysteine desulfurase family protein [Shimazuella kribbensis]|uniref:cysteine desulfurase family protein n=1 Tax=Shimazuella kribbensis TaxID=139808 RepID=UPI00040AB97E|nr:cysteine desulfurase family protein [Shimazuella kribbensis]
MALYLDYGATSPVRQEVLKSMLPLFSEAYGNPGSIHDMGVQAYSYIQMAREQIALALGATSSREILFTSSGTEANNLAIMGAALYHRKRGNHIITTSIEHPSVLEACRHLENTGYKVTYLPVNHYGQINITDLEHAITPTTILVSVMAANNEVGTIQPIKEIAELLKNRDILFHTDAVQFFGKLPCNVNEWGVDLLSIGSHKIYGPKGAGALYIRKGVRLQPLLYGGGQERNWRPSTLNTPAIVGFGKAASLFLDDLAYESKRQKEIRDYGWQQIEQLGDVILNGHPTERLPNNINVSFQRLEGQAILLELNRRQIYVSSGSACSAGKHAPSHVLMAMGNDLDNAYQSLRFTLGRETTKADIDYLLTELKKITHYLKSII